LQPGSSVVDLGCGAGAWLTRLAAMTPDTRLVGVDTSATALAEARATTERLGLHRRIEWLQGDAASVDTGLHDAVLCVGASHAFGGVDGTLAAVRARLKPQGRVVLGDTIWEQPPSQAAQHALDARPDDFPDLAALVDTAVGAGFEVVDGHVSTLEEWDEYEWAWTGALVRWALQQPLGSDDGEAALEAAREHRKAWLHGYRRHLGFGTLVLVDLPVPQA
jgi:cyclopropane fatty-acyl-phospholipid synthase-like methyltransferase